MCNEDNANLNLQRPPEGAWFVSNDSGTTIGASNRNLLNATGFFLFALVWNGIMSFFVASTVACTLQHLGFDTSNFFHAPKMEDGGEVSLHMTVFLWVFITPFVLVGLCFVGAVLANLFGRTEVRIKGPEGTVFTGVGKLGWKRRFARSQIKSVNLHRSRDGDGIETVTVMLETSTDEEIRFGSLFSDERRQFVLGALRKSLFP